MYVTFVSDGFHVSNDFTPYMSAPLLQMMAHMCSRRQFPLEAKRPFYLLVGTLQSSNSMSTIIFTISATVQLHGLT